MPNVKKQYVRIRCNSLWMHKMLDHLAVCQRIPPYYSVFVTCLKLISNVLSVYQRTCLIFHTSAYVGAIRRCERAFRCAFSMLCIYTAQNIMIRIKYIIFHELSIEDI